MRRLASDYMTGGSDEGAARFRDSAVEARLFRHLKKRHRRGSNGIPRYGMPIGVLEPASGAGPAGTDQLDRLTFSTFPTARKAKCWTD
jgi:hypothetical protein